MKNTAFDVHTYKHTTMGFFEDIVDMPNQYEYSRQFFKRYYRPEYCTVVVVGDVTAEQVNNLAQKYPEMTRKLHVKLMDWLSETDAKFPSPNLNAGKNN